MKKYLIDDGTPVAHSVYAVAMQLGILGLLCRFIGFDAALAAGTAFAIGFFLSREHSQCESKYRTDYSPWNWRNDLRCFDPRLWGWCNVLDLIWPVAVCMVTAGLTAFLWH